MRRRSSLRKSLVGNKRVGPTRKKWALRERYVVPGLEIGKLQDDVLGDSGLTRSMPGFRVPDYGRTIEDQMMTKAGG
jgi:hypothetical protein